MLAVAVGVDAAGAGAEATGGVVGVNCGADRVSFSSGALGASFFMATDFLIGFG